MLRTQFHDQHLNIQLKQIVFSNQRNEKLASLAKEMPNIQCTDSPVKHARGADRTCSPLSTTEPLKPIKNLYFRQNSPAIFQAFSKTDDTIKILNVIDKHSVQYVGIFTHGFSRQEICTKKPTPSAETYLEFDARNNTKCRIESRTRTAVMCQHSACQLLWKTATAWEKRIMQ
jgi:hypothetical protein